MDLSELFWKASIEDMSNGYIYNVETEEFICLICGESFLKGMVYTDGNNFFEAERFVAHHIKKTHGSVFEYLINFDKKLTGLTEHQKNLLQLFYEGYNDNDIVKKMGGGSTSTIRNHRFTFREKEKQAKIFLVIMNLMNANNTQKEKFITIHKGATMADERYAISEEENDKILKTYFKDGIDGKLYDFPVKKEKRKIIILRNIVKRFEVGKKYSEKDVDIILKNIYDDHALIRRYLIEYGFLDRERDGSQYWVK
jgi:hypothetical protein